MFNYVFSAILIFLITDSVFAADGQKKRAPKKSPPTCAAAAAAVVATANPVTPKASIVTPGLDILVSACDFRGFVLRDEQNCIKNEYFSGNQSTASFMEAFRTRHPNYTITTEDGQPITRYQKMRNIPPSIMDIKPHLVIKYCRIKQTAHQVPARHTPAKPAHKKILPAPLPVIKKLSST